MTLWVYIKTIIEGIQKERKWGELRIAWKAGELSSVKFEQSIDIPEELKHRR